MQRRVRAVAAIIGRFGTVPARRKSAGSSPAEILGAVLSSGAPTPFTRGSIFGLLGSSTSAQDLRFSPENGVFSVLRQGLTRVSAIRPNP